MEKLVYLKRLGSEDSGFLSCFEGNRDIDFHIKRIYYTYGVDKGNVRGNHAHKSLKQILWCPFGVIEVTVDNGFLKKLYLLDSPEKALVLPEGLWRTILWKQEFSVLCAAVSDYYDEDDYIRNYGDYLDCVRKGYWNNESKI